MVVGARMAALLLLFVLVAGKLSKVVHGGENAAGGCNLASSKSEARNNGMQTLSERPIVASVDQHAKDLNELRNLISREKFQARFVAFNADYKGPRRHPPKNN